MKTYSATFGAITFIVEISCGVQRGFITVNAF